MQNYVWGRIGNFLNMLRCENIGREDYIRLPETEEAQRQKKEAEQNCSSILDELNQEQKILMETYIESLTHLAFVEEQRAYCQGYVDCIQLLAGLGLLKGTPDMEKLIEEIKK